MPYLQLALPCTERLQPRCHERALEDVGALAVTLQDAHLDAADEQAIFEPGVGEIPLWDEMTLTALFDADADGLRCWPRWTPGSRTRLVRALRGGRGPGLGTRLARPVPADALRCAHLDRAVEHEVPAEAGGDAAIVRLDPGLAFGSGTHPDHRAVPAVAGRAGGRGRIAGSRVLDPGCGSGILALAALKLGAGTATGVDNDPQAFAGHRRQRRSQRRRHRRLAARGRTTGALPRWWSRTSRLGAGRAGRRPSPSAPRPVAGWRCRASSPARRTRCWRAMPRGSTSSASPARDWVRIDGRRRA